MPVDHRQDADYQIKVIVRDMDAFQELLLNRITGIRGCYRRASEFLSCGVLSIRHRCRSDHKMAVTRTAIGSGRNAGLQSGSA